MGGINHTLTKLSIEASTDEQLIEFGKEYLTQKEVIYREHTIIFNHRKMKLDKSKEIHIMMTLNLEIKEKNKERHIMKKARLDKS